MARRDLLDIENAEVLFKNFRGLEKRNDRNEVVNTAGTHTFAVVIEDPEMGNDMAAAGWNIKILAPNEDHPDPRHYLPVEVRYRNRDGSPKNWPPVVVKYEGNKKEELNEDTIGVLDRARFLNCDLTINPREWEDKSGETHIKAFLSEMHVKVEPLSRWGDKWGGYDEEDPGSEEMPF